MQKKKLITIGGLPGSGKSTVRSLLAKQLGYDTFSSGDFMRRMAQERGMTLDQFNEFIAGDKETEQLIDAELERIEQEESEVVVDTHLGFHFIPSSFKVYLELSIEEGARRIFGDRKTESRIISKDTMGSVDEAIERTRKRIENHKDRYMRHYGINPYDPSQYDFVVNTKNTTPEEVVKKVAAAYGEWLNE